MIDKIKLKIMKILTAKVTNLMKALSAMIFSTIGILVIILMLGFMVDDMAGNLIYLKYPNQFILQFIAILIIGVVTFLGIVGTIFASVVFAVAINDKAEILHDKLTDKVLHNETKK